jgi:hypothetical protein
MDEKWMRTGREMNEQIAGFGDLLGVTDIQSSTE